MINLGQLSQQLKSRIEKEENQAEILIDQELQQLKQSLSSSVESVLNTINKDLDQQTKKIHKSLSLTWIQPILIGLCLLTSISVGSWGITQYLAASLTNQLYQIDQAKNTLNHLQAWGMTTLVNDQGRFIILPLNSEIETNWHVQKKPAIKILID